jgi:hypothetical protein
MTVDSFNSRTGTVLPQANDYLATQIGYTRSGTAFAQTVAARLDRQVLATDFGVVANGVVDDTAAMNAAIAYAHTQGAELLLPPGDIRLDSKLAAIVGGNLIIRGQGSTRLLATADYGDIVTVGDGVNEVLNVHLRDFSIWSTVARSSGAAVRLNRAARSSLINIKAGRPEDFVAQGAKLFNGVHFNGIAENVYRDCLNWGCANDGLTINGRAPHSAEIVVDGHTFISNAGRHGITIGGDAGGVYLVSGGVQFSGQDGVRVDQSQVALNNREIFSYTGFCVDTNHDNGYYFDTNACTTFNATGGWSCGNGNVGLWISPTQLPGARWLLNGVFINRNASHGIYHQGQEIHVTGSQIVSNGYEYGGVAGFVTGGASTTLASIVGNNISNNGANGVGQGLLIQNPLPVFSVQSNIARGNASLQIQDLAGGGATSPKIRLNNVV